MLSSAFWAVARPDSTCLIDWAMDKSLGFITWDLTFWQILANFKVHQVSPEFSLACETQKTKPHRDVPSKIGLSALVCSRSFQGMSAGIFYPP